MADERGDAERLVIRPEEMAGLFATDVAVHDGEEHFTFDFVRADPARAGRAILVARVAVTLPGTARLHGQMDGIWERYNERRLPPEMWDDEDAG